MKKLIIYAREPRAGEVKTRLGQTIGMARAALQYERWMRPLSERLVQLTGVQRFVAAPGGETPILRGIFPRGHFSSLGEEGKPLGMRMDESLASLLTNDTDRVVMIGSDSPTLPIGEIQRAFDLLATTDAVIGPAEDGGFWLVGLRRIEPKLFAPLPLSTEHACRDLIVALEERGLSHGTVATWHDIDTPEDFARLTRDQ